MALKVFKLHVSSSRHPYVLNSQIDLGIDDRIFSQEALPEGWSSDDFVIHGSSYKLADVLAWRPSIPLLSEKAVSVFEEAAPGCTQYRYFGEIKERPYFALIVTAIFDALDLESSDGVCVDSGELVTMTSFAFKADLLEQAPPLFRLPSSYGDTLFAKEVIPALVVTHGLTGFEFRDPGKFEIADLFFGRDTNAYPGLLP